MKPILKLLTFCLAFVFVVSCGSRKQPKRDLSEPSVLTKEKEIKVIERDTLILTKTDSVQTIVQIDCPENGMPKIKTIKESKGGNIIRPLDLKLHGNQLTIDCKAQAEKLALKLYDKYVKENEFKGFIQEIEKPFTWYHKALMWLGGVFLGIIGSSLLLTFFKLKF